MAAVSNQFRPVIDQNLFLQEEAQLYEPNSERAILALIVQRPELLAEVERQVPPDWFFSDLHRYIYRVMSFVAKGCMANGWVVAFDAVTVFHVARQFGQHCADSFTRKTNGMERWHAIVEFSRYVSVDALPRHLTTMREASIRVQMYRFLRGQQVDFSRSVSSSIDANLSAMICGIERIRDTHLPCKNEDLAMSAEVAVTSDSYSRRVSCSVFSYFSNKLGHFRPGSLTILAGRSKAGKSKIVAMAALGFACENVHVCYLDSEMTAQEVGLRQLSMVTNLTESQLVDPVNATVRDEGIKALAAMSKKIDYHNIVGLSTDQIMLLIQDFRRKIGPDARGIVIYDWMRITDQGNGRIPEHIALGELTSRVKQTGSQTSLPVIALVQQNRNAFGASYSDYSSGGEAYIAGSDRIVQLATAVCHVRGVGSEMATAIQNQFGCAKFTHVLQIDVNRFGESRVIVPLLSGEGTLRMTEVATKECLDFLESYEKEQACRKKTKRALRSQPQQPITS